MAGRTECCSYEPSLEDIFLRYYEDDVAPAKEVQSVAN